MLDSGKLEYEQLTSVEASAIGSHLRTNIRQLGPLTEEDTIRLLTGCPVLDIERKGETFLPSAHGSSVTLIPEEDMMYKRGKPIDSMLLVLTGKVCTIYSHTLASDVDLYSNWAIICFAVHQLIVLAGKDQFRSEAGPWSVIGADAVTTAEGEEYIPDFSAFIGTATLRCVIITREQFQRATARKEWVWKQEGSGSRLRGAVNTANESETAAVAAVAEDITVEQFASSSNIKSIRMQEKRIHRAQLRKQRQNQPADGNGCEDEKEAEHRGSGTSEMSLPDSGDIAVKEKDGEAGGIYYAVPSSAVMEPSDESA